MILVAACVFVLDCVVSSVLVIWYFDILVACWVLILVYWLGSLLVDLVFVCCSGLGLMMFCGFILLLIWFVVFDYAWLDFIDYCVVAVWLSVRWFCCLCWFGLECCLGYWFIYVLALGVWLFDFWFVLFAWLPVLIVLWIVCIFDLYDLI